MNYRQTVGKKLIYCLAVVVGAVLCFVETPIAILGVVVGLVINRHPKSMNWYFLRKICKKYN